MKAVVYRRRYKYIVIDVMLLLGADEWRISLWSDEFRTSYQSRFKYTKSFANPKLAMRRGLRIAKRIYREDKA